MTTTETTGGLAAREGTLTWEGLSTWYRVVGDLGSGRPPVVVCHGGPGLTHDYLLSLTGLARSGRAVVLYDQVGNGRSEHRPDAPADFWTPDLFRRELVALIGHLGIGDHHLLGHSWGGMLALEYATGRPAGLRSAVVASAFAASATYTREVGRLVAELPADVRATIERHEAAGTTDAPEYGAAVRAFYRLHVCRASPVPDEVRATLGALGSDPTVYATMCGPSEFSLVGTLRDWDIRPRLGDVGVPVLLVSGRHDEVTPAAVGELHEGLTTSEWVVVEDASHMAHVEEPELYLATVAEFLARNDPRNDPRDGPRDGG